MPEPIHRDNRWKIIVNSKLSRTLAQTRGNMPATSIHVADVRSDNYDQEFSLDLMESKDRSFRGIVLAQECIEDVLPENSGRLVVG